MVLTPEHYFSSSRPPKGRNRVIWATLR